MRAFGVISEQKYFAGRYTLRKVIDINEKKERTKNASLRNFR